MAKQMAEEIALLKKKLSASESATKLGADPNIRVLEVLKQLGITATVNPDGTLQLADGRILGSALAVGGMAAGGEGTNSAATLGFEAQQFEEMMSGASSELKELVADLQHQMKQLKNKNKEKKDENEKMKKQLQENQNAHSQVVVAMKRTQQQLQGELTNKARKLDELTTVMKEAHGNQIQELVSHNQKILMHQHQMIQNVPASLKVNSDIINDAKAAQMRTTTEERSRHDRELRALEFGRTVEMDNMRQQYEFWLSKKTAEAERFVSDFNLYRSKRNETIAAYETELLALFEYSSGLKTVIDTIKESGYTMKKTRTGLVPVIPARDLPEDMLGNERALGKTLRLVKKRDEAVENEKNIQDRATMALRQVENVLELSGAGAAGKSTAIQGRTQLMQGGAGNALRAKTTNQRPQTAPRMRDTTASQDDIWVHPPMRGGAAGLGTFDDSVMSVTTADTKAAGTEGFDNGEDEQIDFNTDVNLMDENDLRENIKVLRRNFERVIQKRVMAQLTGHETVNYIKELEDEKTNYRAQLREQSLKFKDLRVAYESLQRKAMKAKAAAGVAGAVPGASMPVAPTPAGTGSMNKPPTRPQSAAVMRAAIGVV